MLPALVIASISLACLEDERLLLPIAPIAGRRVRKTFGAIWISRLWQSLPLARSGAAL